LIGTLPGGKFLPGPTYINYSCERSWELPTGVLGEIKSSLGRNIYYYLSDACDKTVLMTRETKPTQPGKK